MKFGMAFLKEKEKLTASAQVRPLARADAPLGGQVLHAGIILHLRGIRQTLLLYLFFSILYTPSFGNVRGKVDFFGFLRN